MNRRTIDLVRVERGGRKHFEIVTTLELPEYDFDTVSEGIRAFGAAIEADQRGEG